MKCLKMEFLERISLIPFSRHFIPGRELPICLPFYIPSMFIAFYSSRMLRKTQTICLSIDRLIDQETELRALLSTTAGEAREPIFSQIMDVRNELKKDNSEVVNIYSHCIQFGFCLH